MYVVGVWGGPIIYLLFPLFLILFGRGGHYFELFIITLWTLMLSDYVPVDNAPDDLKFAKDLKPLLPLTLVGFLLLNRHSFKPYPKIFNYFIPFFIIVILALTASLNVQTGIQKTISFVLIYFCIPIYTLYLHRQQKEHFWKALITFIIGMLSIGILLRFAAPDIAMKVGRFKSVLGNPNGLGIFLNLTFILWILVRRLNLAQFTKRENVYILVVILLSLIWSGSRNGMMSMFLFYVMFRMIQLNWFFALIILVSTLVFSDQLFLVFLGIVEFFGLEGYFRVDSIEEGSGRSLAWAFAWQELQNFFFIGGGFGNDENIMRPNYFWLSRQGHQGGVHNSYLSMWMDAGVLGLVAYFTAILTIAVKAMRTNYLIIAFISSFAFNIYFESWLVASLNPFTIMFLIILTIFASNLTGEDYVETNRELEEATT